MKIKRKMLLISSFTTKIVWIVPGCAEVKKTEIVPVAANPKQAQQDPTTGGIPVPIFAEEALVTLDTQPALTPASFDARTSVQVPGFKISFVKADYVQMLRCAQSYKFRAANGKEISELLAEKKATREDMRSAWMTAWASFRECSVVGDKTSRENFVDFTAGNKTALDQNFYYVLNPCVRTEMLKNPSEPCSFNLKITQTISYKATHEEAFFSAAGKLAKLEDSLSATYGRLQFLAGDYRNALEICDFKYQQAVAAEARKKALGTLIGLGVKTVSSAFLMGAAPAFLAMKDSVGNAVAQAFAGQPANLSSACPAAEAKLSEAQNLQSTLATVIQQVQTQRSEMATANASYAQLDIEIKKSSFGN